MAWGTCPLAQWWACSSTYLWPQIYPKLSCTLIWSCQVRIAVYLTVVPNFQRSKLSIHRFVCYIVEMYPVRMDSNLQLMFAFRKFQFGGIRYLVSGWSAKYFTQELSKGLSYRDGDLLISFFHFILSLSSQAIEFVCLKPAQCVKIHFFAPELSSSPLARHCLWVCPQWSLVALKTLDSENRSPHRQKVLV